jgi:hypothetical protein
MDFAQNRLSRIVIVSAILFFAVLYVCAISSFWKITPDSGMYVLAGKSLAAGDGYKVRGKSVPVVPPMTSLIFGICLWLFPSSYLALHVVTTLFTLLSLFLCFVLFKDDMGEVKAGLTVLLSAGSVFLFRQNTFLLSDMFYFFFSVLALVLVKDLFRETHGWPSYILLATTVLVACMTRTVGLTLALAIAIASLTSSMQKRSKKRLVLAMAAAVLPVLLWEYRNVLSGRSYFKLFLENEKWVEESGYVSLGRLAMRLVDNLGQYASIGAVLSNGVVENPAITHPSVTPVVVSLLCAMFGLGMFLSFKRTPSVTGLYSLIYLTTLGLYNHGIEMRFFMPILPFLFYYAFIGLEYIIEKSRIVIAPFASSVIYVGVGVYIIGYLGSGMAYMLRRIPEEHKSPFGAHAIKYSYNYDTQRLAMWLKDHSPLGASYICQHPLIMDLLTERECYEFPFSRDSNKLLELLRKERIRYLLIDKKKLEVQTFLLPVIYAHPSQFSLIKDEKAAALYEFDPANSFPVSETH